MCIIWCYSRVGIEFSYYMGSIFSGNGPFSAVIDMFGTAGTLAEFRAALLASRGFVAYALPYFAHEDLPNTLENIHFEYFMVCKILLQKKKRQSSFR